MPAYVFACRTKGCEYQGEHVTVVKPMNDPDPTCACGKRMKQVPSRFAARVIGGTPIHHHRGGR